MISECSCLASGGEDRDKAYREASRAVRERGLRVITGIIVAVLVWLFGNLLFLPIAQGIDIQGYPMPQILSFIILAALGLIIFSIFFDAKKLIEGFAGILAYEVGKAGGEPKAETFRHYKSALNGIFYVIIVVLAFLLFSQYLTIIHPALSGLLLIIIVIWSILMLWRSGKAVALEIGRGVEKWAGELEPESEKKEE